MFTLPYIIIFSSNESVGLDFSAKRLQNFISLQKQERTQIRFNAPFVWDQRSLSFFLKLRGPAGALSRNFYTA
jgi:hypothetical protein